MRPCSILLADDHAVVLEGLRRILDRPEFKIVGTVSDGQSLVEAASNLNPDVILADISMPVMSGIQALREMRRLGVTSRVIFLTMHPEVPYALETLTAGASGYVLKSSAGEELLDAIREVLRGGVYVAADIRESVEAALEARPKKIRSTEDLLTPRQREVLALLAQGLSAKETAARLKVSPKTIDFHKQQMKQMLGIQSVAELVIYAARHGLSK
jgi:DNA-binding NarL/FixJ family response regulator